MRHSLCYANGGQKSGADDEPTLFLFATLWTFPGGHVPPRNRIDTENRKTFSSTLINSIGRSEARAKNPFK
jgi:hypothetical protein